MVVMESATAFRYYHFHWERANALKHHANDARAYLMEAVEQFPWYREEPPEQTKRGRKALLELARRIQEPRVRRCAVLLDAQPHDYFFHLREAQKAIQIGRYGLACHELQDVLHMGRQLSWQVLYNVLKLIRTSHLEE